MKESYGEEIANRTGPKLCVGAREGTYEALVGVRAGWVLSRENYSPGEYRRVLRGADAVVITGRSHRRRRYRKASLDPAWSETPSTHGNTLRGNREILRLSAVGGTAVRIGKSKDARR